MPVPLALRQATQATVSFLDARDKQDEQAMAQALNALRGLAQAQQIEESKARTQIAQQAGVRAQELHPFAVQQAQAGVAATQAGTDATRAGTAQTQLGTALQRLTLEQQQRLADAINKLSASGKDITTTQVNAAFNAALAEEAKSERDVRTQEQLGSTDVGGLTPEAAAQVSTAQGAVASAGLVGEQLKSAERENQRANAVAQYESQFNLPQLQAQLQAKLAQQQLSFSDLRFDTEGKLLGRLNENGEMVLDINLTPQELDALEFSARQEFREAELALQREQMELTERIAQDRIESAERIKQWELGAQATLEAAKANRENRQLIPKIENELRNELAKHQSTVNFVKARDAHEKVLRARFDTAAGDFALIYNFNKVLDPPSTIRESEFTTTGNLGGLNMIVQRFYNKLENGKLPDAVRADLIQRSEILFASSLKRQQALEQNYTELAARQSEQLGVQLNPANIVFSSLSSDFDVRTTMTPEAWYSDDERSLEYIKELRNQVLEDGRRLTDGEIHDEVEDALLDISRRQIDAANRAGSATNQSNTR